jgi:hypothetical protein
MSDLGYEMGMEDAELGKQLSVARATTTAAGTPMLYTTHAFSPL